MKWLGFEPGTTGSKAQANPPSCNKLDCCVVIWVRQTAVEDVHEWSLDEGFKLLFNFLVANSIIIWFVIGWWKDDAAYEAIGW